MSRNHLIEDTMAVKTLLILLSLLFLYGFSFSDPSKLRTEIRKEIKAELEKIIEKTPSGKLRTTWRQKKQEAEEALNKALFMDSPRFCPEKWDEAVMLFKKAKKYASKREYRKAIYLAKKTIEFATGAEKCASRYIKEHNDKLEKQYTTLRNQMDEIMAMIPPDAEDLVKQASNLSLKIEDMYSAIKLRQFKNARDIAAHLRKRLASLEKAVKKYNMEHGQANEL